MAQLAYLQGSPAKQLIFAADKPAGSVIETDLFQDLPIPIHVPNAKPIQDQHDVNIAVFVRCSTQITALQAHIQQPITEGCPAGRNQSIQITVQIKRYAFTPCTFIKYRLNDAICAMASSAFAGSRSQRWIRAEIGAV